jgi:signal transduction histidine kinase/ActR/RegA family two-component response regulator
MMKNLGARFLLPFAVLAILFSAFILYQTYTASRQHVSELMNQQAALALEFNLAIRTYAGDKIRPVMELMLGKDGFNRETMSTSFISRSIFEEVRKKFPEYIIRFSSEDPRNPLNMADADELKMIEYFRSNPHIDKRVQEMMINGQRYLAHFKARYIKSECLRCHGDPKDAPPELLKIYGSKGSFHRKLGDVVGLDMVAVPIEKMEATLASDVYRPMMILGVGLVVLFALIVVVFRFVVTRRLGEISGHFQKIATGEENPFPVSVSGNDEITLLSVAFNRLVEQVSATHASLEDRVQQRTAELAKKNEELKREVEVRRRTEEERQRLEERLSRAEKMEALGTLAGGVAHDLNNVLGVLVGYSELLLVSISADNPLRKYVNNILMSGEKGAAIIQDLLTMARRGVAVSEVVRLNALITECLKTPEFERLHVDHPGVTFRTELENDLLNIKGSPVHLGKTIVNLLYNAAEAFADRGEVTIRTENRYLSKPIRGYDEVQAGDYVVLAVSDNGKGIAAKDLGKIFEPFYTKKVMGRSGTGLGLAVVWGTVKDHNGYIDVESEEGKGSTFTLYIPVSRDAYLPDQKTVSSELYRGSGESILVIDDVKEQRELAMNMLGVLGYEVAAVSSGEDALEYLKTKRADLLVLDMIMDPGMDGLETYRRVIEIHPGQKALIVSGFSETDRVREAQTLGAGAYVRKPYIMERIGLAVRKELDRR